MFAWTFMCLTLCVCVCDRNHKSFSILDVTKKRTLELFVNHYNFYVLNVVVFNDVCIICQQTSILEV